MALTKSMKELLLENTGIEAIEITEKGSFDFKCDACGECCRNSTINMILYTPLDVYNLSKGLGIECNEFINKYSNIYIGSNSKLPVVQLKSVIDIQRSVIMNQKETVCPFLENKKCKVHKFKPSICKLYPLGRCASADMNGEDFKQGYFLIKDHCGGTGQTHTINKWIPNRQDDEKMLSEFAKITSLESKLLHLQEKEEILKIKELPMIEEFYNKFYNAHISLLYGEYDLKRPFWEQWERNLRSLIILINAIGAYIENAINPNNKEIIDDLIPMLKMLLTE